MGKKTSTKVILFSSIICCILIILAVLGYIKEKSVQYDSESTQYDLQEPDAIIAESSYINFAWGFQYNGTVICNDGSIYKFSFATDGYSYGSPTQTQYEEARNNLNNLNKCILENKTEYVGKVSEDDLKNIKKYSKNIDSKNYNDKSVAMDAGSTSISIWNYELNEKITLKRIGDYEGNNFSKGADNVVNIIKKYVK